MLEANSLLETIKHAQADAKAGTIVNLPNGGFGVLIPQNMQMQHVSPIERKLTRIKQTVTFPDAISFIRYVNTYKTENTKIFADLDTFSVTAVFDYHKDADKQADHCAHKAIFKPALSMEWLRWAKQAGNMNFSQAAMGEFFEENLEDIRVPDASTVLEVVRNLELTKKSEFKSVDNPSNGARELVFKEKIQGKGEAAFPIPESIELGIPVFFSGYAYPVKVFIRFRLSENETSVRFVLKVHRSEYVEKQAFQDMLHGADLTKEPEPRSIAAETGVPVFIGTPNLD